MSVVKVDTSTYQPPVTLPTGSTVQLVIKKAELKLSKAGDPMLTLTLAVVDQPTVSIIFANYMIPNKQPGMSEEEAGKHNFFQRNFIELTKAFNVDFSQGVDTTVLEGLMAWAILKQVTDDFGEKNEIAKWTGQK